MRGLGIVVSTALLVFPAPALAQNRPAEEYEYRFEDDPLSAVGQSELADLIRVRAWNPRTTLIRPRTHFVPELLKSVEGI